MALAWLVLGVLLVAVELTHLAFFALFAAVGAFAAAIVAWIAPSAVPLQVLVAIVVAALGIWLVRPLISRRSTGATRATSALACTAGWSARRCSPSTPSATRRGPATSGWPASAGWR